MLNEKIAQDLVEMDKNSLNSELAGSPSSFVCPECGGAVWEINKGSLRKFQCHINHSFSVESLLEGQAEEIEHMLWTLLRTLNDRVKITRQMAEEAYDNDRTLIAQQFEAQAQQALQRAELIRQALLAGEA